MNRNITITAEEVDGSPVATLSIDGHSFTLSETELSALFRCSRQAFSELSAIQRRLEQEARRANAIANIKKMGGTHITVAGEGRFLYRLDGLPNVHTPGMYGGHRVADRSSQIGPGPDLEGLPRGCRKWRPMSKIEPWRHCDRWRLAEGQS